MTSRNRSRSPSFWTAPGILALGVVVGVMFLVAYLGLAALRAGRALSQGESWWTLQQKDLVIAMERYAMDEAPRHRTEVRARQGDLEPIREALTTLISDPRDWDRVRTSLRSIPGFNRQAESFARLFRWFGWTPHAHEILEYWSGAQERAEELSGVADSLLLAVDRGDEEGELRLLARVEGLDREIQGLREGFISTQEDWAHSVHVGSVLVLLLTALFLTVAGSLTLIRVLRRAARSEAERDRIEGRLRQVTEAMDEVFWLTSPDKSGMLYVSPGFEELWEWPVEELYRSPSLWLEAVHPDDRTRVEAALPHQQDGEYDLEYRIRTASGETRWIHDRAAPVLDDAGEVEGLAGVATDVTRRKLLEEELLRTQRLRTASHLAAGVAHDINNLLTVIRGHLEFLTLDLPESSPLGVEVEAIREAAGKLAGVSRELLALGRSQILIPSEVQVNELLEEVKGQMEEGLDPAYPLVLDLDPEIPQARADRIQLTDCVRALVWNARAAMPEGGKIHLRTHLLNSTGGDPVETVRGMLPPDRYVVLQVKDGGRGIDEGRQEVIFEPFAGGLSLEDTGALGLAAVLGIMEQMGGGIRLKSEPGKGTLVEPLLPVADR